MGLWFFLRRVGAAAFLAVVGGVCHTAAADHFGGENDAVFSGGNLGNIDPQGQQTTFGQWCNQAGGTWQKCRADTVGNDANLRVPFCNFHTQGSDSETDAPVAYVYDDQTGRNPGLLRGCRADYRASQYAPNEQYQGENVGPQARRPVICVTGHNTDVVTGDIVEFERRIGKAPPCHYAFLCPGDPGPNPFLGCATTQTVSFYFEPAQGTVIARWRDESGSDIEIQSGATVLAGATITFTATPETSSGFVSGWGGHCADIGETPGAARGGQAANCVIAATTNLSVSVVFGAACVAPQVRPVDICETPSADVCAKFNPGRFFNAASASCDEFLTCEHSATLDSATNLCECNSPDFGTPDFCHPSHEEFCEAHEPEEFLDPETGECEELRFGGTDSDFLGRDGGPLDNWCSAVGGTWRRTCRPTIDLNPKVNVCEFAMTMSFRGEDIEGCRVGHNQHLYENARARGEYDIRDESLCRNPNEFVFTNLCHYVFPECPFGLPYEIAGNPFSGCGGLRVSLSASAGGTVSVESGGAALTDGIFGSGQTLTFTATPESGFHYVSGWSGGCDGVGATLSAREAGGAAECVLSPSENATVGAVFSRGAAVAVSGGDNGVLRLESAGEVLRTFGASGGTAVVSEGTETTLFAVPDSGYYVLEWTGECREAAVGVAERRGEAGTLGCGFSADGDMTLGAVFARGFAVGWEDSPANGTVSARLADGTSLSPNAGAAAGATVIWRAVPAAGYYVSGWTAGRLGDCDVGFVNAGLDAEGKDCRVTMTADAVAGVSAPAAVFAGLPRSTIYFSAGRGGTLRAEGEAGRVLAWGDSVLHQGSVWFSAEADAGWMVSVWSGGCSGTAGTICATVAGFGEQVSVRVAFVDVDECVADAGVCGEGSVCSNLEGGFMCECVPPNVGTAGDCRVPSAEVCAGLDPPKFYDSNLGECVAFAECGTGMVLDRATNVCMDLVCGTGEVLNEAEDACVCGVNRDGVDCACASGKWAIGGACVNATEEDFANEDGVLCVAFRGEVKGDGKICAGLDEAGTFCILDSETVFPCRGLFKRVRFCNMGWNRVLVNPFVCGRECGDEVARGKWCE